MIELKGRFSGAVNTWVSVRGGIGTGKRGQWMGGCEMGRNCICRCVVTGVYREAALKVPALRDTIQLTTSSRLDESAWVFHPVDTLVPVVSV